jgi:hypothetical protein
MRSLAHMLAVAAMASAVLAVPAANAAREDEGFDKFVKMYPRDKDGMVSKQDVMKTVEKMFDKHDTKKMGKLDRKQLEIFLQELMKASGG